MKGIVLGFWHSLRGFYRWYSYDQPKLGIASQRRDGSELDTSTHQTSQPLTSLALKKLHSKEQHHTSSADATNKKPKLGTTLYVTMSYNIPLVLGYVVWAVLKVLPYRLVSSDYFFFCNLLNIFMQLCLFLSRLLFAKLINVLLQNQTADHVYKQALGRTRATGYARTGSDLYATLQLQIIYYLSLSVASMMLAWFGVIGHVVSVFLSTPYWSLYSFDYCWYYLGVPFQDRLTYIERNWPYFVGFGLPLALIDIFMHPLFSSSLPLFLLPFFIISAVEATALGNKDLVFSGSALHFFSLPIWLSDALHGGLVDLPRVVQRCVRWYLGAAPATTGRSSSQDSTSRASTPLHPSTRDVSRSSHSSSVRRSVTPDVSVGAGGRRPPDSRGGVRTPLVEESPPEAPAARPLTPSQHLKVASWLRESAAAPQGAQSSDASPWLRAASSAPRPPPSLSSTLTAATAVAPTARRRNLRSPTGQDLY
ncbi:hypothetical protein HAZT_HAZT005125 [Hyalella azteca]|nr:hypothetical protein HAZT_HAZT005125 [Hyalella azteca]